MECPVCGKQYDAGQVLNMCECGGPLLARYDLDKARKNWNRAWIPNGPSTMWRYQPVLPVKKTESIVSLGEGFTPIIHSQRLGRRLDCRNLWIKDEGANPTGTYKARALSCAVSMAVELGLTKLAIASTGNGAAAMAAYAAATGIKAHVFMPRDVSRANYLECMSFGASVTLVDGGISDCRQVVAERLEVEGFFDVSSLKEPYSVEGLKTIGYEIAEQFQWQLPDVIICPVGDGLGLIGMWRAFTEIEQMGWISNKRPKMIAVQAAGCQPIVRAFEHGVPASETWENVCTVARALRVPKPAGDFLLLDAIYASKGAAIAVSDEEMLNACINLASQEGIFAVPGGAACAAAMERLLEIGVLRPDERILICNPGSGLKNLEAYSARCPAPGGGEQEKLGGLITPR